MKYDPEKKTDQRKYKLNRNDRELATSKDILELSESTISELKQMVDEKLRQLKQEMSKKQEELTEIYGKMNHKFFLQVTTNAFKIYIFSNLAKY